MFLKVLMLCLKQFFVLSTLKAVGVLFSSCVSYFSCFSVVLFESPYSNSYVTSVAERKADQPLSNSADFDTVHL